MKYTYLFFALSFATLFASAQKTDKKLHALVSASIKDFRGDVGVYIKNLRTGRTVMINADTVFPTASIVKVPILLGVMDKIEKGELDYETQLVYKDSLLYE